MIGQMQMTMDGQIRDKVEMAIHRLQAFCPEEGYYVAFSGGKDSQCIYHLCEMAGVKFDAHYNVTSVDPPELIWFIQKHYPQVHWDYPRDNDGKVVTMWNLIPRNGMPPTRLARYCCEWFKEASGKGRITVTGVRWAESTSRAQSKDVVNFIGKTKTTIKYADKNGVDYKLNKHGSVILNDDNDDARRMVELCYRTRKTLVNPIVDWEDEDVWQFLQMGGWPHCELYDRGKKRIGCIGCPMNRHAIEDFEEYPKYKENYLKAFARMIKANKEKGIKCSWETPEEVYRWWLQLDGEVEE